MQKIRKILRAVSEKTALPTNQPIIANNTDLIGPRWRRSNKLIQTDILPKQSYDLLTPFRYIGQAIRKFLYIKLP